jgi:hypothetical protein
MQSRVQVGTLTGKDLPQCGFLGKLCDDGLERGA